MKSRFPGGHVWRSYVHTYRRGINTCADRTGQPPVTADTDTPFGKLFSMLQAKTQTALHSSFRNSARAHRPQPGVLNMTCLQGSCAFQGCVSFLICLYKWFYFFSSHKYERTMCTGTTKGQNCSNIALPFSRHCFQRILWVKWPDVSDETMNCQCEQGPSHKQHLRAVVRCQCVMFLTARWRRYPVESLSAAVLQLHGTVRWWTAVLCSCVWHHTPDTSLWRTCQENGEKPHSLSW